MKNIESETNITQSLWKLWECGHELFPCDLVFILVITDGFHGLERYIISQFQRAITLGQQTLPFGLDPRTLTSVFSTSDNCYHVNFSAKIKKVVIYTAPMQQLCMEGLIQAGVCGIITTL
jgi:hypothetical protein